jgi:hypothetical protein
VVLEDRPTGPRWFLDPAFDPAPGAPEGAA